MFMNTIRRFSPIILRFCKFSSITAIERSTKLNPKSLFCNMKVDMYLPIQHRNFAGSPISSITNISYDQLKTFIQQNEALIIDVRSKDELAITGVLPNSYNIPLDELCSAFELAQDEFLNKYNTPKPDKDQNIVFSCAKGIRSLKACHYVADLGYKNIFNYAEGWFGWETHK